VKTQKNKLYLKNRYKYNTNIIYYKMLPTNKNSNLKINNENVETGTGIDQSNYLDNLITTNNLLETSFLNIEPNTENLEECDNKSYCYQAIECLNSDISSLYNSIHSARVHLCIYNVNTTAKNPYLEYFLVKNNFRLRACCWFNFVISLFPN